MIKLLVIAAVVLLGFALVGAARGAFKDGFLVPLQRASGPKVSDHFVALALAALYTAIVLATAWNLGFMRDEGMYFDASKSYAGWFEKLLSADKAVRATAFEKAVVDAHWSPNSEHPSLMKSSFALSWIYLWKTWPEGLIELFHRSKLTYPLAWMVAGVAKLAPKLFTEESASFRFPGMVAGGLILYFVYLFASEVAGRAAAIAAVLLQAALPRPFFDAHLAGFDAAATLAWVAVAYAYWRGLRSMGWAIGAGVVWGLALLMKHNSWFLPVVFVVHYSWLAYDVLRARPGGPPTFDRRLRRLPVPWPFLFMGMFGPAIFVYGWPRLWFDTWARIDWYFTFHARHDYYNIEFLHQTYFRPPFPVIMVPFLVAATVPLATLLAGFVGMAARWRAILAPALPGRVAHVEDDRRTSFFLVFNFLLPIAIITHPKVPHFGGTKHWHPAYPFLCIFAGMGVVWVGTKLAEAIARRRDALATPRAPLLAAALVLITGCVVAPGALETKRAHPHGLTHYTPLVGGPSGGADLGLTRGFWGYETGAIVGWLKRHFPNGGRVYANDTFHSSWEQLRLDGRLPMNVEAEWWSVQSCDVAVIEHEQHMDEVEHQIWVTFGTVTPKYVVTLEGAPTLTVYVNPKSTKYVP
ncbi:MAG: glycosyltransferase family 39 protein [Deltaproteobacteria bacterium]|nr:glycosyltransferase family 39 protein [Deltaproteobacteria bacterium]